MPAFANERYWQPGTSYLAAIDDSPWKSNELARLEYRIFYLLEADLACRNALEALEEEPGAAKVDMVRTRDSIDEVLETLYAEAVPHLQNRPHPYLLTMMLYHQSRYVNSAMERWEDTIGALRAVDREASQYVQSLLEEER